MDKPTTTVFWNRRRLWIGGAALGLALAAAAGHWLPDVGLRYGLVRALREAGWTRVSVSEADLSLFNGAIVVHRVEAGESLGRALGLDGLDVRFRWRPLFSRRVSLERIDLQGLAIDIHREGDGFVVNGLPVVVGGPSAEGSAWSYDITSLRLAGSRIEFTDGDVRAAVEVDSLEIDDLRSWEPQTPVRYRLVGRVNGAPVRLEGTATPFAASPRFAVGFSLDAVDLAQLTELARRAGIGPVAGRLAADLKVEGGAEAPLTASGRVRLSDAVMTADGAKVAAATLDVDVGRLDWDGRTGRATLQGTVQATGLAAEQPGATVRAGLARLDARAAAWDGKAGTAAWEGSLHAERPSVAFDTMRVDQASLDWNGAVRLGLNGTAPAFRAEGRAEAVETRATIGVLAAEAARLVAEGVLEPARAEAGPVPLSGRLEASAEQVWLREPGRDWLHADRVEARDVRLPAAASAHLEARNLAALAVPGKGGHAWRLEVRQVLADRAALAGGGGFSAGTLSLIGATARVTRTKAGILGLPQGGGEVGPVPRVAVGRLRVGGDSRIEFEDRAGSEPVRLRIDGVEATLNDLDSTRPDGDSRFTAKARIGAAQMQADGRARPFAAQPGGDLKAKVRALDLPPLSPYAADTLGVHLQTGQLDADIAMAAAQGKLDGGMQLTLSELFVAQPDPGAPLAKQADMPVETVLDLLRDSENRIHLSIPVRGDLSNPDFDVSDAVGQTVGAALRSTVFTTLKVAFPLAGLISLVIDDAEGKRLALEPLAFPAGGQTLDEGEHKRLETVARLMEQRPTLRLTLCGVANARGDWPALFERLRAEEAGLLAKLQKLVGTGPKAETVPPDHDRLAALADARAQAAKEFLVERGGIEPGRLFTCRPRVEMDAAGAPRVDLVL